MDPQELNRRDFHRLTMAAFGGVLAGAAAGCGTSEPTSPTKSGTNANKADAKASGDEAKSAESSADEGIQVAGDPHACSGLNACKNQGASGKNECAGTGDCATKAWHHTCHGQNACKGQGGCGATATTNDCKGKGGCHIPLMGSAWKTARKHFEEKMKADEKEFGEGSAPKLKKL